ncbi:hypothetical protein PGT21_003268 [Puccinia graminis f. sp. tritici]|uniref:Uncharacterized protein n=1 Tax=Puccinia graminis f. sp. tritici TaxID=56615 RepID=A0A5B0MT39_PUCGR|nr:hypothetical protein PGTUg99_016698 [Puccinia graminis f. sp. tritici]KAA1103872.1 hypothetical protein PGT21_003268 [Puccinia graminis f. sp. tritici]
MSWTFDKLDRPPNSYLKRIILNGRESGPSNHLPTPSSQNDTRLNQRDPKMANKKKRNGIDPADEDDVDHHANDGTRPALDQLNVVTCVLARHLARCLTCTH